MTQRGGPGRLVAVELQSLARRLLNEEGGQDVVEYGILLATVALVELLATTAFGNQIDVWFGTLAKRITTTGTR